MVEATKATTSTSRDSDRANVTVPYNSPHNISVIADFCGRINASTITEVYYGKRTIIAERSVTVPFSVNG